MALKHRTLINTESLISSQLPSFAHLIAKCINSSLFYLFFKRFLVPMYKSDQPILVAIALTGCIQNDTVKLASYGFVQARVPILNCQCTVQINIFVRVKYQI